MPSVTLTGRDGRSFAVETELFINNEFVPSTSGATLETLNAYTRRPLSKVSAAGAEDVDRAVQAASEAFLSWRTAEPSRRSTLLLKLAELVERDAGLFATIEALDAGVLFHESQALNVPQAVETLRYFAALASSESSQMLHIPQGYAYTRKEPYGVTAAIVPWNAPLMISIWKLAPAIAAGNVMILKTPELAPLSGQHLGNLVVQAGFPPGVINIVCGYGNVTGRLLSEHMEIRKLAFTGSSATGRLILKAAAESNLKKVTVELGGKGPSIVFDDADLENAAFWTKVGSTAHNGQVCALGSRIYVQDKVYERFLKEFQKKSAVARYGDPLDPETTKGPIISEAQMTKVLNFINNAKRDGAKVLLGGHQIGTEGTFVEDTVFIDTNEDMEVVKEEVFGPVASLARFESEEEAIAKANDSQYGLSAAIFTTDSSRAYRVSAAIECGTVTVNCWGLLNANTPFGGVKQSGFGRDMGVDSLAEWTTTKTVKYLVGRL